MALDPELWDSFTADPHSMPDLRASDADRDAALDILAAAYAEGLLDGEEHAGRMQAATAARRLGEFVPLLTDIVAPSPYGAGSTDLALTPANRRALEQLEDDIPTSAREIDEAATAHYRDTVRRAALGMFLGPVGLTVAIWAFTSIAAGNLIFFWPLFVILGTGGGFLSTMMNKDRIIAERRKVLTTRARAKLGDPDARAEIRAHPHAFEVGSITSSTRAERRRRKRPRS